MKKKQSSTVDLQTEVFGSSYYSDQHIVDDDRNPISEPRPVGYSERVIAVGGEKKKRRLQWKLIPLVAIIVVRAMMLLLPHEQLQMTTSGQDRGGQQMKKEGDVELAQLSPPALWYEIEDEDIVALQNANEATLSMPDEEDWLLSKPYYNKEDYFQKHEQLIPKHLHKVILTTTGKFSEPIAEILNISGNNGRPPVTGSLAHAHLSWKMLNPGYAIRYFNLHLCRKYLKQYYHPIFLRAFDCIEAFAGKSDLFRTLVVYREGGFYSDWKEECKVDSLLKQLSSENTTWFSAFNQPGSSDAMQNAFFGALPGSPILAESIRITLHNIQSRADLKGKGPLLLTGPGVLGDTFFNVGKRLGWDLPSGKQRNEGWDRIPGIRLGGFMHGWGQRFIYNGTVIVLHKCDHCGKNQDWSTGNNYNEKFAAGEFYCPDAASLFLPK